MNARALLSRRTILMLLSALCLSADQASSDEVRYATASWDAQRYGNHRVVIRVDEEAPAVQVHVPWRRRDLEPEKKNVIFVDAATGARVNNVCPVAVNREYGDFIFEPATVPGDYHVYYLPNVMTDRSNYPTVVYPKFEWTAEQAWLDSHGLSPFPAPASSKSSRSTSSTASSPWKSLPPRKKRPSFS
ncbi:MAG: glycoside hydrolase domain-containing protein [Candidatus Aminicenantales bacterium]